MQTNLVSARVTRQVPDCLHMTDNAARDKKKALVKNQQAPMVQINSLNTSGITSFSTSASIEA
jgi:hypothetical protein